MKTKEITVSTRYVKNLGNCQSFTAEASLTAEVEDESLDNIYDRAWSEVKSQVRKQIQSLKTGGIE